MKKLLYVSALSALLLAACGETEDTTTPAEKETAAVVEASATEEVTKEETKEEVKGEAKEDDVPREFKNALKKAEMYASTMDMSKAGIYDQLTSEFGENFPAEAGQYAIDNIEWDWKENALSKAKMYAETMAMSDSAVYEQLTSEHGEKFTPEEAQYAVDNL